MKTYDGLVFDLDGTLWNSTVPVTRAWNEAARSLGQGPVSQATIESIMGLPHDECFRRAFPHLNDKERAEMAKACTNVELELLRDHGAIVYPGVKEGLAKLAAKYPLFVVSNCDTGYLNVFIKKSGLGEWFRDSECYGNTGQNKGVNIRSVVARNKLQRACYIGDTPGDQMAALQAGMDYYHVTYGFGDPDRECPTFDRFGELVDFFLGL